MSLHQELAQFVQGQKIVKVRLNRLWDEEGKDWYYQPTLELENGVVIHFGVQETQAGEYGILPILIKKRLKPPKEPKK